MDSLFYRTSRHNILDQRYIVQLKPRAKVMNELDEVDDTSEDDNDKTDDSQQIFWRVSSKSNTLWAFHFQ